MMRLPCSVAVMLVLSLAGACPAAEVLGTVASYKRYLDEPASATYGAAVRVPVFRKLSLRPEVLADTGTNFSSILALGSVILDFSNPERRAVGYAVFSSGIVRTLDERISFSASRWVAAGGAGVRFAISDRWIAAAEARVGMPVFPLITFNVGYRWGSR